VLKLGRLKYLVLQPDIFKFGLILLLDLFLLRFSLIFLFVPCGGLSWLHVSLLLHVEYMVNS